MDSLRRSTANCAGAELRLPDLPHPEIHASINDPAEIEPLGDTGWDEAKNSVKQTSGPQPNLHRVRLWWQSRMITWLAAGLQLSPLSIFFFGPPEESVITGLSMLMAFHLLLCLLPWLRVQWLNLLYPFTMTFLLLTAVAILEPGRGFTLGDALSELLGGLFINLRDWQFWPLRVAFLAALMQLVYKATRQWGRSRADQEAIGYWWRRPKNDEAPNPWG